MRPLLLSMLASVALSAADMHVPAAMNAFTVESYKHVARGDGNLILSPFNIGTALSMLLAGARGDTAEEIRTVLHVTGDSGHQELGALLSELNKEGNSGTNELCTSNAIWVQKGFPIEAAFENTLKSAYGASATPLDFIGNVEPARVKINAWTAAQTKDKIKDLLPPGSLDASTRLVLTSAIYFYGKWQVPFRPANTKPAPFTVAGGNRKDVRFMNQTSSFSYAETPIAQLLELRYGGTTMAFDVFLPKNTSGLSDLQKSFSVEFLDRSFSSLVSRRVQVSLPKFRAESDFSLGKELSQMGMPKAFSRAADFSGINRSGQLAVSDVFHKAFVDVSEEGTEAAAATGIGIKAMALQRPESPVIFRADHPFIFLIRDTRTGVVLFIGRLTNPS